MMTPKADLCHEGLSGTPPPGGRWTLPPLWKLTELRKVFLGKSFQMALTGQETWILSQAKINQRCKEPEILSAQVVTT